MKRYSTTHLAALLTATGFCLTYSAKLESQAQYRQAHQADHSGQEQAMRQQDDARRAREAAVRAQEEQARAAQGQAIKQQMAAQQEAARQQQRVQQEAALQQRNQAQEAAKEQQRLQQEASRQQQAVQQEAARQQRNQAQDAAKEQQRLQQEASNQERQAQREAQQGAARQENEARQQVDREQEAGRRQQVASFTNAPAVANPILTRQFAPRPVAGAVVPLERAIAMPVLEPNIAAEERDHAAAVERNLRAHLLAVAASQAPVNIPQIQEQCLNVYSNGYPFAYNNELLRINRQNTFIAATPQYEYPYWWQPKPGWVFSNGFTLGSQIQVGLDWLRWGWHPYYGPLPDGFVCSTNYMPTPWIYVPAYGLWRLAGSNAWAPGGPPLDYAGPITVEVLEPKHVNVQDPYTRLTTTRVINVPYLYNAFFYPQADRWGYSNRHGYFVWLNL